MDGGLAPLRQNDSHTVPAEGTEAQGSIRPEEGFGMHTVVS